MDSQANESALPMAVDVVAGTRSPEAMDTAEGDSASQVSVFGKRTERDS